MRLQAGGVPDPLDGLSGFRVWACIVGTMEAPYGTTERPCYPGRDLDQLLAGSDAKSAFDSNGLLDQLKKALAERAPECQRWIIIWMAKRRRQQPHGYGKKTVLTDSGRSSSRSRAIGNRASIPSFWPSISVGSRASTTRSCRCMPGSR